MTPRHHLPDELLFAYATGGLNEAESLLVAVHASLCARCARLVAQHESVAGALLSLQPTESVSDDLLARTMARLDDAPLAKELAPVERDAILPLALLRVTGPADKLAWKQALPFIANCFSVDLPITWDGVPVRLRRFRPGTKIPTHTHAGPEFDLILSGSLVDHKDGSQFTRGDISMNDERVTHELSIGPGEWCWALSVHSARAKPIGLLARYVFGYTGW